MPLLLSKSVRNAIVFKTLFTTIFLLISWEKRKRGSRANHITLNLPREQRSTHPIDDPELTGNNCTSEHFLLNANEIIAYKLKNDSKTWGKIRNLISENVLRLNVFTSKIKFWFWFKYSGTEEFVQIYLLNGDISPIQSKIHFLLCARPN